MLTESLAGGRIILDVYFAGLLGVAGLSKASAPLTFASVLYRQRLLPARSVLTVAYSLPWVEVLFGAAIISGLFPQLVAILVLALFVAFVGAKMLLLRSGRGVGCGCAGERVLAVLSKAEVWTGLAFVLLAAFRTSLVLHSVDVTPTVRELVALPATVVGLLLLWRIRGQVRRWYLRGNLGHLVDSTAG